MARSGHEALRLLLEHDVALILLDVRMPELDGVETARLIKGRARTRDVPIVFLTAAHDDIGAVLRGYGVGAVDYVLKPFDPERAALQGGGVRGAREEPAGAEAVRDVPARGVRGGADRQDDARRRAHDRPVQHGVRSAGRPRAGAARGSADPRALSSRRSRPRVGRFRSGGGWRRAAGVRRRREPRPARRCPRTAPRSGSGSWRPRSSRRTCLHRCCWRSGSTSAPVAGPRRRVRSF